MTALDRLRELRAQGRLEREYAAVAGLLADEELAADPDGPRRAARLLARLDPDAVTASSPGTPSVTVAITGQSTVAGLVDPLTVELARHGLLLRPLLGDHGAYRYDLADPGGRFHGAGADLALCLLDPETVFARLPAVWRPADVERAGAQVLAELAQLVAGYQGVLVLNTVPLTRRHTHQLIDRHARTRLALVWREFNAGLLRLAEEHPGVQVIDLDPLVAETGPVHDPRLAAYARAHYTEPLLTAYAREVAHLARALRGLARKCLVVDLDQTLWDGVLGDDGPDGIAAAGTPRGEAFGAFQRVVKQLGSQGVLLAVSSKNDPEQVAAVLRDHPDLVLRPDDFVRVRANWEPKDGNLLEIAGSLGIAPGALVFADDSPAERARVRHGAPEVALVALDDEPALHASRLLADGWFDCLRLTAEDEDRARQYRLDAERARLRERAGGEADFLRELRVGVELAPAAPHELERFAQLTQRTNQFNLTGLRLTAAQLALRAADPRSLVLAARTSDRFGPNGLTGAVLGRWDDDGLHLENVWLSCRVFSRGIEQACLAAVLALAAERGARAVHAWYRATPKNGRTRGFYPALGFATVVEHPDRVHFRHDLAGPPAVPDHIVMVGPKYSEVPGARGVTGTCVATGTAGAGVTSKPSGNSADGAVVSRVYESLVEWEEMRGKR
ncbi:HAD-IIIC family phosphatase [Streptomyces sp. SP17BM10]|uniref:HAD-IIIC family phosphatase n=1 Tax=Streptomyces sp. SP17BM10 TaxID=3002530 RepID=UPI002E7A3EAE|nr:HAD-IIIC family phosphatase [Streptomyces sp. SP17BM10]MEE1781617.1 HAD-IIIC family phosphatase [Streptomyces sp. SP17BM10]